MWFSKKNEVKVDVEKDLNAVISWMDEVGDDLRHIYKQCKKMEELRSRKKDLTEKNMPEIGHHFNLAEQLKVWDQLLKAYEFFDDDVEINKKRVQMIGRDLRNQAKNSKIPEELKDKIKNNDWWNFRW